MSGIRYGWLRPETEGPFPSDWNASPTPYFEPEPVEYRCVVLSGDAMREWERNRELARLVEGERRDEAIDALMEVFAFWGIDEFDSDDASRLLDALLALLDAPEPQSEWKE